MRGLHGLSGNPAAGRMVLALVLASVGLAATAQAGPRRFVLRDGRTVELTRSTTELAIELDHADSAKPCAQRLASKGIGIIQDYPGTVRSRFKLLRVADVSNRKLGRATGDPAIRSVRAVYRLPGVSTPYLATGTFVARVRSDLTPDELTSLWSTYRVRVVEPVDGLRHTYLLETVDPAEDEVLRAEAVALDSRTVWSHPNFRHRAVLYQALPGDPLFSQQWHLSNTGQGGGTAGADISVLAAWEQSREGLDVIVGMYDDACDVGHEDLAANYLGVGDDATLTDEDPGFDDPNPKQIGDQHGTAVMGLAVASANDRGIRGVAFRSRFTVSRGLSEVRTFQQDASVYTFARQQNVDVHINSWGYASGEIVPPLVEDAIDNAVALGRDPDGEAGAQPARGMVVVFAQGNGIDNEGPGVEIDPGSSIATRASVIAVGASTAMDTLASFSNYGTDMEFLAPGGGDFLNIVTTDNDDDAISVEDGFNKGGFNARGELEVEPTGRYTSSFSGTSASCPIVAGVAALMLSSNQELTATDVRVILEHTCDRISPNAANYNNITGKSLRYGFGRVNAEAAVLASNDAFDNLGDNWPRPVSEFVFETTGLTWKAGDGTREFLVVESVGSFNFPFDPDADFPRDGACYLTEQIGCSSFQEADLAPLPVGVSRSDLTVQGCEGGNCGSSADGDLQTLVLDGVVREGLVYAVYGRNRIGRYSWGREAVEAGSVTGPPGQPSEGPNVTIVASVTEGMSPLTVQFTGNAQKTAADVDQNRAEWDFDIDEGFAIDATMRNATHTYLVAPNESRTFIARLTMYDVNGIPGAAQVTIRVEGSSEGDTAAGGTSSVRIIVGVPGSIDSDNDSGVSPFSVVLSVDATTLVGELQSIVWDLGDGTSSTSLVVPHIFTNTNDVSLRIPVTARITTRTSGTMTQVASAQRLITVVPGPEAVEPPPPPVLPGTIPPGGGGASLPGCGALGLLSLTCCLAALPLMRRRRIR